MQSPENGGTKVEEDEAVVLGRVRASARELAGRLVRGRARADDIAQEVVLDYLRRLRSGRAVQPEREDAYIATIVLRRRSDMRLRRRRGAARDWSYLSEITASRRAWMDPEVNMRVRELEALYRRTLDSLPLRCRQAFIAVREQGQSYAQAAQSLGVSVKMIAKYITQAQRVFRDALRQEGIRIPREKGRNARVAFVTRVTDTAPVNALVGAGILSGVPKQYKLHDRIAHERTLIHFGKGHVVERDGPGVHDPRPRKAQRCVYAPRRDGHSDGDDLGIRTSGSPRDREG
jgi:RNA polymerase sigma-70 factor (ECF subfamily)